MEINGSFKKIRNILGAILIVCATIGSIWTYVEKRITVEVATVKVEIEVDYNKKFSEAQANRDMVVRFIRLCESERRLAALLADECPDKMELQKEYDSVQKHKEYIIKKFRHMEADG